MSPPNDTFPIPTARARNGASLVNVLRCVLLGVLAFAGASAILRTLVPWPEEYGLRAKHDWFVRHKDEFDVAFLGSSRVFRGIDPRVIDASLAAAGVSARSCNLAVGGMTGFESDYFLKELLELRPAQLKTVVIEDQPWDASSYFLGNTFSSRSIFWHSPAETMLALRSVAASDEPVERKLEHAWTHVRLCGMKLANVAQGPRIALDLLGRSHDPLKRALTTSELDSARGFQALDDLVAGEFAAWREKMLARRAEFEAMVAGIPAENARAVDVSRYDFDALAVQVRTAEHAGVALVRLLPPASSGQPEALELARRGVFRLLLDYNDPIRYPQFFAVERRFDDHHLDSVGAAELSRLVGADLAPILGSPR